MVKIIRIENETFRIGEPLSACIGFFDGMHRGHQELMKETIGFAEKNGLSSALICFDPDPYVLLHEEKNAHIFSQEQRIRMIENFGFDVCLIIHFDDEMMKMDPIDFINKYLNRMDLKYLVYGFDFRFGYQGRGNSDTLKRYGSFESRMIPEYTYYGTKVSSTRIKDNLLKGNLKLVNRLLGFNYYLNLKTVNCSQNGSKWLIEAIVPYEDVLIPKEGVYPGLFEIRNGRFFIESDCKRPIGDLFEIRVTL